MDACGCQRKTRIKIWTTSWQRAKKGPIRIGLLKTSLPGVWSSLILRLACRNLPGLRNGLEVWTVFASRLTLSPYLPRLPLFSCLCVSFFLSFIPSLIRSFLPFLAFLFTLLSYFRLIVLRLRVYYLCIYHDQLRWGCSPNLPPRPPTPHRPPSPPTNPSTNPSTIPTHPP